MRREILRMDRVSLGRNAGTLIEGLSFYVFEREIMGIIGIDDEGLDDVIELIRINSNIEYGFVYFDEKLVNSYRYSSGQANSTCIIEKNKHVIGTLTVLDNIFVLNSKYDSHIINKKKLLPRFEKICEKFSIFLDPNAFMSDLSEFDRVLVEALKSFVNGDKLIILRKINSFLSARDVEIFQRFMRKMVDEGVSFLHIFYHHEEAFVICDRLALYENGKILRTIKKEEFYDELIWKYALEFRNFPERRAEADFDKSGVLCCEKLVSEKIDNVSFSVEKGECSVILDTTNTAIGDFEDIIAGDVELLSGRIEIDGEKWQSSNKNSERKISLIRADPTNSMVLKDMSYIENLCLPSDHKVRNFWMHNKYLKSLKKEYHKLIGDDIFASDVYNIQKESLYKLVYYRERIKKPKVVFIHQPFAYADMYERFLIVELIDSLKLHGISVVILAVNLADCLSVANKLLIMKDGKLIIELERSEFDLVKNITGQ